MPLRNVIVAAAVSLLIPATLLALQLPPSTTVEAGGPSGSTVTYTVPTGGADHNGRTSTPVTCAPASGSLFPLGRTTVTCRDANGQSGTFFVDVVDTTAPTLRLPDSQTANATSPAGAAVHFDASASDIVDGNVGVACTPASGSTFAVGTTSVRCTARDAHGNTASGAFTVTVNAYVPPPPPPRPNLTVEATGPDGAAVRYGQEDGNGRTTESDNCTPRSGSLFPLGTTTVRCDSGSFTITVVDTTPPVLTLPRPISVTTTNDQVAVTFSATAHDLVDGDLAVHCTPASGSLFAIGRTTVSCSAADTRGNTSGGSFTVLVLKATLPNNIVVEATGPNGAVVTYSANIDDENGRPGPAVCTPPSGSTFPLGQTVVNCSTGSFIVTVVDTKAPELQLPANITAQATSMHGAEVTFTAAASDVVDGSRPVTCTPPSGSLFGLGTTVVACSASDAAGNGANGTFSVTVTEDEPEDTEPPAFVSISASPNVLTPPNKGFEVVTVTAEVLDNADPAPLVRIFAVTANETISASDWKIAGPLAVELRRDRDPHGNGRVYTIHVEAIDASGNRSVATVTATVPHGNGNPDAPATVTPQPPRRRGARSG